MLEANVSTDDALFTGEDKTLRFTLTDRAGAALNITGWSLSWMLKAMKGQADNLALITKTTGAGITITVAAGGLCEVSLEDVANTDALAEKLYWHELKRTDAGFETVLSQGTFPVRRALHRA